MKAHGKNVRSTKTRKTDRRIVRTRDVLGDALVALMHEKPFDDITVQDVLDRAGVGRATFYSHYSDKHDLFLSDIEEFFERFSAALTRHGASAKRLLPVQEFFTHIREVQEFYRALMRSGKAGDVRALALGIFARAIEARLQLAGVSLEPAARSAQSHALSGCFFSLLDWWIDKGMKEDPKQMDELFHRLAWSGLGARAADPVILAKAPARRR